MKNEHKSRSQLTMLRVPSRCGARRLPLKSHGERSHNLQTELQAVQRKHLPRRVRLSHATSHAPRRGL